MNWQGVGILRQWNHEVHHWPTRGRSTSSHKCTQQNPSQLLKGVHVQFPKLSDLQCAHQTPQPN